MLAYGIIVVLILGYLLERQQAYRLPSLVSKRRAGARGLRFHFLGEKCEQTMRPLEKRCELIKTFSSSTVELPEDSFEKGKVYAKDAFGTWKCRYDQIAHAGKSVALPIFLHGILISIFQVSPAMAKPISRALSGSDKLKVGTIRSAELQSMPKWIRKLFRIWRKLFAGSFGRIDKFGNKANNIPWKSVARVAVIIIAALTLSTVMLKWEDFSQTSRLKNEIKREVQYRESMFFDAVADIVKKLEDPKVKSSMKEDLRKELRDLDPKSEIQAYLKGKGSKPDLSKSIAESMQKKAAEKEKIEETNRLKMERLRQTELREGMARMKAEAEAEEAKRFRAKIENDVQRKRMEQISPQSQSAVSTGNRHMRRSEDNENENGRGNRGDVIEEEEEEDDGYEEAEDFDDTEVEQAANQVFSALKRSLATSASGKVSVKDRERLVQYLEQRLLSLPDAQSQHAALENIRQRVNSVEYWERYISKLPN